MLNRELVSVACKELENSVESHQGILKNTVQLSIDLFELRRNSSDGLIVDIEKFINTIAATPKEFSRTFAEYKIELNTFDGVVHEIDSQIHDATVKGGTGVGVGVAAGAATAFAAPTAAMAVATTFGAASTGTAISALSGAAATNAALAWLGGGALAAGGGGMSAGGALLALAGPVGLAIAGLAAAGGAAYVHFSNASTAEEAIKKRVAVDLEIRSLLATKEEIQELLKLTKTHVDGMSFLFDVIKNHAPKDYKKFDTPLKNKITSLVNNVHTLGKLLNKKILAAENTNKAQ